MSITAVILAAGLGTRMKSARPKVLHSINGKPLVRYVVEAVQTLKPAKIVVVISPGSVGIREALRDSRVVFSIQKEPRGTADALRAASQKLAGMHGTVLVLSGDAPLISTATLKKLLTNHRRNKESLSILSFSARNEHSYGRIMRESGRVVSIIESRDATPEQKKITEVNSGIYAIASPVLKLLKEIKVNPGKGEFYLTDIVGISAGKGLRVGSHMLGEEAELTGINTRRDLCMAGLYLRDKTVSMLLEKGVSFVDIKSVFIDPDAEIGADTVIYPNVVIEGKSSIGIGCVIYPNARISDSILGNNVEIKDSTVIESSEVKDGASVGPFAHLRPGSVIGSSAKIGNFVEIKKTNIGACTKAAHLSYLGDAEIGDSVNIGAGTITCNYDGVNKFKTIIEEGSFIGSDTQLVAPVRIGKGAYVGAGSTITKDVPPLALAVSRTTQRNFEGWAAGKSGMTNRKSRKG